MEFPHFVHDQSTSSSKDLLRRDFSDLFDDETKASRSVSRPRTADDQSVQVQFSDRLQAVMATIPRERRNSRWTLLSGLNGYDSTAEFDYKSTLPVDPDALEASEDFQSLQDDHSLHGYTLPPPLLEGQSSILSETADLIRSPEPASNSNQVSELQMQVNTFRMRLWRRTMVLEEVRRAYLRDVVSLKHVLDRVLTTEERSQAVGQYIRQIPSADLKEVGGDGK
jgi:hypothetical protein